MYFSPSIVGIWNLLCALVSPHDGCWDIIGSLCAFTWARLWLLPIKILPLHIEFSFLLSYFLSMYSLDENPAWVRVEVTTVVGEYTKFSPWELYPLDCCYWGLWRCLYHACPGWHLSHISISWGSFKFECVVSVFTWLCQHWLHSRTFPIIPEDNVSISIYSVPPPPSQSIGHQSALLSFLLPLSSPPLLSPSLLPFSFLYLRPNLFL